MMMMMMMMVNNIIRLLIVLVTWWACHIVGGGSLLLAVVREGKWRCLNLFWCQFRYPESALPSSWKHCPDGRRRFSNFFIVFAFVVSFMGFIQPVSSKLKKCRNEIRQTVFRRSMHFVWCCSHSPAWCWWWCSWRRRRIWGFWIWVGGVLESLVWPSLPGSMIGSDLSSCPQPQHVLSLLNFRFFCPYWASVGFPYLHGVWHILIFLSSYTSIVLFAYCDVMNHMPNKVPVLM